MIRVLIADNNPESHELIDDLIEINFRDVEIDRALTGKAFFDKINAEAPQWNLILFNLELDEEEGESILTAVVRDHSRLLERMVVLTAPEVDVSFIPEVASVLRTPFSLDEFGEVVRKHCVE